MAFIEILKNYDLLLPSMLYVWEIQLMKWKRLKVYLINSLMDLLKPLNSKNCQNWRIRYDKLMI